MCSLTTDGSPEGILPTVSTPWSDRLAAALMAMPATSTTRPPGTRGR